MSRLRIATRKSALALWQTEHVAERLRQAQPGLEVELVPLSTRGDEVLDRSLAAIGGKGLFLKELEVAMERGEADCAVHSLKDVPMELDPGFQLAAILTRANPFDAWVSSRYADVDALPAGAVVGSSSLRRQAQLKARRPDVEVRDLRGNVNTRLAKLDQGLYDGIILACAGLERLEMHARIRQTMAAPDWMPAPAQGAIAIECHQSATRWIDVLGALNDVETRLQVSIERAMNRALHGSCQVPVAAFAERCDGEFRLRGLVGDAQSGELLVAEAQAVVDNLDQAEALGIEVAERLLAMGGRRLLGA